MTTHTAKNDLTHVYYDGVCKLCSREINYYKKIAPPNTFCWVDIASDDQALQKDGITQSEALRVLHVKDAWGKLHTGVDAFEIMWKNLPKWRILALILKIRPIKYVARIIYSVFAERRFERSAHCKLASQKNK